MASAKSIHEPPPLQISIKNDEQLQAKLAEEGLKVIELFSWAGACSAVLPTFKRLRLDHDADTLSFILVDVRKCSLIAESDSNSDGSEPKFLFFRNGFLKTTVYGADTPAICRAIAEGIVPSFTEEEDTKNNPYAAAIAARSALPAVVQPPPAGFVAMSASQILAASAS